MNPVVCHPYSQAVFDQMAHAMREVQTNTTYVTDQAQYGQDEYWAYPKGKGDCEDYALAIIRLLRKMGWDLASLDMGICYLGGEGHATVIAHTSYGDWIMDNNLEKPTRMDLLKGYRWIEMSTGGKFGPHDWVKIDGFA